jgi:phosphopentomutase
MRALLLILESASCGDAHELATPQRPGCNTLSYLLQAEPPPELPALYALGLWKTITGDVFHPLAQDVRACWGRMRAQSGGRETTTGHWEMAGVLLPEPFPTFEKFPDDFVHSIEREAGVEFLDNRRASGAAIIEELGAEHLRTRKPILYTSDDSVLQIAAHEEAVPLQRLYEICRVARRLSDKRRIGRVIARPFLGRPGHFERTAGRRDHALFPPRTVLNAITEAGLQVAGVGKVSEMFAGSGVTRSFAAKSNAEALAVTENHWAGDEDGLNLAKSSDFEPLYANRRNAVAYVAALQQFDAWLSGFLTHVESDDLVIISADHGHDTAPNGASHAREEVPLFMLHQERAGPLGTRRTYADVAATLAQFFSLRQAWPVGESFLTARATRAAAAK